MLYRKLQTVLILFSFISFASASELMYGTYIGGTNYDYAWAMTVDPDGNVYITGDTYSNDFPTTSGAYDQTFNSLPGTSDVFVVKLNPSGTALLYATYLGGSQDDYGYAIAIDTAGNAYITGATYSVNFPTIAGSYDISINNPPGNDDAFVSKLNPSGSALVYSTYLGGNNSDHSWGIAVDNAGNAYVTGVTKSTNFPTTAGAYDQTHNGNMDIFVTKLNNSGTALSYSTFIGGTGNEAGYAITLDTVGNAYIAGATNSSNYPTTSEAIDRSYNGGGGDGCLSILNPTGSSLLRSTYLGGTEYDAAFNVRVANSGNIYLVGMTQSVDFPTKQGSFDVTFNGVADIFVTKLNASVSTVFYSTYLGGTNDEQGWGLALDNQENAYITGYTAGLNFPTTVDAYDRTYNGGTSDIILSKLNTDGTALVYSTFIGGSGNEVEIGLGIGLDKYGNAYIAGPTSSPDFPTTVGAYDTTYNGLGDVYAIKVSVVPSIDRAIYSDINNNSLVDQGDTITLQFDNRMRVNTASTSSFYLPVAGDSLGSGATVSVNTANDTQVIITLGLGAKLQINGIFSMNTVTAGAPSGIDISATMPQNAIEDIGGTDAVDGGILGINDSGVDILNAVSNKVTAIIAANGGMANVATTINDYYQKHKLVIPAGSLPTNTTITAGKPGNNFGYLSAVSFSPATLSFDSSKPATVVIEYKDADIRRELGYLEQGMRIHQWKDTQQKWIQIPQTVGLQVIDTVNKTVAIKINRMNMVDATGNFDFAANTTIVYANIAIPTVGAKTAVVLPAPAFKDYFGFDAVLAEETESFNFEKLSTLTSSWVEKNDDILYFTAGTSVTITIGTAGMYTKHKLVLTNYTTAYSGTTVILTQVGAGETYDWPNHAILKIITLGTITTSAKLTMEYKDYTDPNGQFTNDVLNGYEPQLRLYRWRTDLGTWEKLAEPQSVNRTQNTVTATLSDITIAQIYAVGIDTAVLPGFINSYGAFTISSDISKWYLEKYGDASSPGTLTWLSNYSGQPGVLKLQQAPGQKGKLTQLFSIPSTGWYTATVKVATDIPDVSKQQKVYLYLQELSSDSSIIATANQVLAPGSGAFIGAGIWRNLEISFYLHSGFAGVQVVGINPSSGVNGSLYIDDIWVTAGSMQPTNTISINNASFTSNTSGWLFQIYGDATSAGTWSWISGWSGQTGVLKGIQAGGQKAKISQLFSLFNTDNSALASVWVYSAATSKSNTQKIYVYVYSQDAGYTKIIESANAILQPGKWNQGSWQQLQFGYIPSTNYNALQLVAINPSGKPTQSIYFDTVEIKQD